MNNGAIEASFQELKASPKQQVPQAVNMDEVLNEVIHVKIFHYREYGITDDEGNPFLDEQGMQYMGREVAGTRTAKIKNIVPVDAYHEAIEVMNGFEGGMPSKDQLDHMTELVLKCWQISEPFMTKKALRESMDGDRIMALFTRFFNRENPPQNTNPSTEGSTTQEG